MGADEEMIWEGYGGSHWGNGAMPVIADECNVVGFTEARAYAGYWDMVYDLE